MESNIKVSSNKSNVNNYAKTSYEKIYNQLLKARKTNVYPEPEDEFQWKLALLSHRYPESTPV